MSRIESTPMTPPKTDGAEVFAAWNNHGMAHRHAKCLRDPKQLAKSIIDIGTGQGLDGDQSTEEQGKGLAAETLGRKGGRARVRRQACGRKRASIGSG